MRYQVGFFSAVSAGAECRAHRVREVPGGAQHAVFPRPGARSRLLRLLSTDDDDGCYCSVGGGSSSGTPGLYHFWLFQVDCSSLFQTVLDGIVYLHFLVLQRGSSIF